MDEFQKKIEEYKKIITYNDNSNSNLAIDELLLLLAELIGDEDISKVVDKYVKDFYEEFEETKEEFEEKDKLIEYLFAERNKK